MIYERKSRLAELGIKQARLRKLMRGRGLRGVVLSRRHNFAWATGGGDNHVRHASDLGVASAVFLSDGAKYVVTSNIEGLRVMTEEVAGLGFELRAVPWYAPEEKGRALREILGGGRAASDDGTPGTTEVEPFLPPLRMNLTGQEMDKYRWLGREAGRGIGDVCRAIRRGMTEEEVAGNLFARMQMVSVKPTVLLVAADDRILKYRHPIPTANRVKKTVMVVMCARRWGLVCSVTRLVHFGKMSPALAAKHEACAYVDGVFMNSSKPGVPMARIFAAAQAAYAEKGFPGEWRFHHQGGPTGYIEREFTANPTTAPGQRVRRNMALAWNPSIAGTKSEDTILVTARGAEVVTATPGWPQIKVKAAGRVVSRPGWLVKG